MLAGGTIYVWPALAVALVGVVGGLAVAAVRALRAYRDAKRLARTVGERVGEITSATEEIEVHLSRAAESSERLTAALESLRRSRAQLQVLLDAIRESRVAVRRAVPFLGDW